MKTTALGLMGIYLFLYTAKPGFANSMNAHKERLAVGKVSEGVSGCPFKIKIEKKEKTLRGSSRPAREFRDR